MAMIKRCLIIIDLLNDYLDRWDSDKVGRLVQNTNRLIRAFRKSHLQVVWVRQAFRPDLSDAFLEMRDKTRRYCHGGHKGCPASRRA